MLWKDKLKNREYQRSYHLKTWEKRKKRHYQVKLLRRVFLTNWLKEYKENLCCIKCSENNPICLDFHHPAGVEKDGEVATMVNYGYSVTTITNEINKCIVLCANCHRKEHGA